MNETPSYPHASCVETLAAEYVTLAWANGERALQIGRWQQIKSRLESLETDYPGITAAVMAGLAERRKGHE
jgi:hypothetical protein